MYRFPDLVVIIRTLALLASSLVSLAALATHASVGQLALELLHLALLLGLGVGLLLAQDVPDTLEGCAPVVYTGRELLVLLLAKHTVGDLVDEEHAALLRQFALN